MGGTANRLVCTVQNRQSAGPGRAGRGSLRQPGKSRERGREKSWALGETAVPADAHGLNGRSAEAGAWDDGVHGRRDHQKRSAPERAGRRGSMGGRDGGIHAREGTTRRHLYGTAASATGYARQEESGGAGRDDFILASERAGQREWDILDAGKQERRAGRDDVIHASERARQREWVILSAAKEKEGRGAGRPTRVARGQCGTSI